MYEINFLLQIRQARLLEDKENLLMEKVKTEANMIVVKEVSVHAAVNVDGL